MWRQYNALKLPDSVRYKAMVLLFCGIHYIVSHLVLLSSCRMRERERRREREMVSLL